MRGLAHMVGLAMMAGHICLPLLPCTSPPAQPTGPTGSTGPTSPAPLPHLPISATDSATSYLENPGLTDSSRDDALAPPLIPLWQRTLQGELSYPLIVGGLAFVGVNLPATGGPGQLLALNLARGRTVWSQAISGTYARVQPAYDGGRIMALDDDGLVRGFDASSGKPLWQSQLPGGEFEDPPVASNGSLYAFGEGNPQTLSAIDDRTGHLEWSTRIAIYPGAALAIDASRVYLDDCGSLRAYSRADGHLVWQHAASCARDNGPGVAVFGDQLATDDGSGVVNALTGAPIRPLGPGGGPPIVADGRVIFDGDGNLTAYDPTTGRLRWRRTVIPNAADETLAPLVPVAVGRDLFVAVDHQLEVLDIATGRSRGTLATDDVTDQEGEIVLTQTLASAEGVLVAASGTDLSAYASTFFPPARGIALRFSKDFAVYGAGQVTIDGRLGATFRARGAAPVTLVERPFPYHAVHTVTARSFADGDFRFNPTATRDTRFQITTRGGHSATGLFVIFPQISFHNGVDRAARLIVITVHLTYDPHASFAGRPADLYLSSPGSQTLRRLGSGTLQGGHGHSSAQIRFAPPAYHVSPKATIEFCTPHESALGFGVPSVIDRDCGQPTITVPTAKPGS